jgi:hypothetical protein
MAIALAIFGVAFAAFCVWLGVRVYNRRERWAKWVLAVTIFSMPVLYVLSFGPACWWMAKTVPEFPGGPPVGANAAYLSKSYWPIGWVAHRYPSLRPMLAAYSRLLGQRTAVLVPISGSGNDGMVLWHQPR